MLRYLLSLSLCLSHVLAEDVSAFIVMNAKNGKVLAEKAAYEKMSPASTTKIATVAYVLGTPDLDLDQKVAVPPEALKSVSDFEKMQDNFSRYPSHILEKTATIAGLKKGEVLSIRDLLFANMVVSGGDAANTLAYYWGDGSIEKFMERLNRFIESLGCKNTHFKNPHGLHHPEHLSCAYDLALMARFAMQNPTFRTIVSTSSYTKPKTNKQPKVTWRQNNELIAPKSSYFYEAATGIKTGYHSRAQRCIVASAENSERSLIAVALRCPEKRDQFSVPKRLLEQFLVEKKKSKTIIEEGPIQLTRELEGHSSDLSLRATSECSLSFYPSEEPAIRSVVEWEKLSFPIKKGQKMGVVHIFADDEKVAQIPIISEETRKATWKQRFLEVQHFLGEHKGAVLILAILLCLFFCYVRRSRTYF